MNYNSWRELMYTDCVEFGVANTHCVGFVHHNCGREGGGQSNHGGRNYMGGKDDGRTKVEERIITLATSTDLLATEVSSVHRELFPPAGTTCGIL
ncbi:hypothetical protein LXL04_025899 [Taraxacum kok-saghyz]